MNDRDHLYLIYRVGLELSKKPVSRKDRFAMLDMYLEDVTGEGDEIDFLKSQQELNARGETVNWHATMVIFQYMHPFLTYDKIRYGEILDQDEDLFLTLLDQLNYMFYLPNVKTKLKYTECLEAKELILQSIRQMELLRDDILWTDCGECNKCKNLKKLYDFVTGFMDQSSKLYDDFTLEIVSRFF